MLKKSARAKNISMNTEKKTIKHAQKRAEKNP
jgi:hypothetical protein